MAGAAALAAGLPAAGAAFFAGAAFLAGVAFLAAGLAAWASAPASVPFRPFSRP